jgi:hypothetical protein
MNPLVQELIKKALDQAVPETHTLSPYQLNKFAERLCELVAQRCVKLALDYDDPYMAVEISDLFGIN